MLVLACWVAALILKSETTVRTVVVDSTAASTPLDHMWENTGWCPPGIAVLLRPPLVLHNIYSHSIEDYYIQYYT